jgi:hypothetical protein
MACALLSVHGVQRPSLCFLAPLLAAALASSSAAAQEEDTPPPPPPKKTSLTGYVDAGWGHRSFYSTASNGASIGGGIGAQIRGVGVLAALDVLVGSTELGLPLRTYRLGPEVEGVLGLVRIGGGLHMMLLSVSRASSDSSFNSGGFGFTAHVSFDVWQPREREGLFLRASLSGDHIGRILGSDRRKGADPFLSWGSTLGVGYRF